MYIPCTVNWICVHLNSQLVIYILLFVYTCTFNWFCVHLHRNWFCDTWTVNWLFIYESNSSRAKGSVFAPSCFTDCTKFACWLHKFCNSSTACLHQNKFLAEQLTKIFAVLVYVRLVCGKRNNTRVASPVQRNKFLKMNYYKPRTHVNNYKLSGEVEIDADGLLRSFTNEQYLYSHLMCVIQRVGSGHC